MHTILAAAKRVPVRDGWSKYSFPLFAYLCSRVVAHLGLAFAAFLDPVLNRTSAINAWDVSYYLDNARFGYPSEVTPRIAFFPGFPWTIDASKWLTGLSYEWSAVVAATFFGALATILLWKLVHLLTENASLANRTVLLFVFFPGAFVFTVPYSESLMIVLALASLIALHKKYWVLAGLFAACATATRSIALALAVAALWASFQAIRKDRDWRSLAAPLLAPLGLFGYLFWIHTTYGSYTHWQSVQKEIWGQNASPFASLKLLSDAAESGYRYLNHSIVVLGMVILLVLAVAAWRRRANLPGELWAYSVAVIGVVMVSLPLMPKPRFLLTAFPLFLLAAKAFPEKVTYALVGLFGGLLALIIPLIVLTRAFTP